jgi:hypothetical protein
MKQLDFFMDVERRELDIPSVDISTITCDLVPDTFQKEAMKRVMDLVKLVPQGKLIAYKTGSYHPNKDRYPDPIFPYMVNTHTGKEIPIQLTRTHYPSIDITLKDTISNRSGVSMQAHKLFAWCFLYNPDHNLHTVVDHLNGDKQDYSIENLEWVTQNENRRRIKR